MPGSSLAFEEFQAAIAAGPGQVGRWESFLRVGVCESRCCRGREKGGVVNWGLRVYGAANERILDASVVPVSLGQHTMGLMYVCYCGEGGWDSAGW